MYAVEDGAFPCNVVEFGLSSFAQLGFEEQSAWRVAHHLILEASDTIHEPGLRYISWSRSIFHFHFISLHIQQKGEKNWAALGLPLQMLHGAGCFMVCGSYNSCLSLAIKRIWSHHKSAWFALSLVRILLGMAGAWRSPDSFDAPSSVRTHSSSFPFQAKKNILNPSSTVFDLIFYVVSVEQWFFFYSVSNDDWQDEFPWDLWSLDASCFLLQFDSSSKKTLTLILLFDLCRTNSWILPRHVPRRETSRERR